MTRKQAREFAMQTMFQIEVQKDFENPDIDRQNAQPVIRKTTSAILFHRSAVI